MVGHGGSSASSYLADPTSPIPSHCASIVVTSTVRVKESMLLQNHTHVCQVLLNSHLLEVTKHISLGVYRLLEVTYYYNSDGV